MASIFVAWELGAGLGHVVPLQPIVDQLAANGHQVIVALRSVNEATMVFRHPAVRIVQAPILRHKIQSPHRIQYTYAHILHNMGFDRPEELRVRCHAWKTLYDLVQPDVILFDHSPTALLASYQCEAARICLGLGFCCPPPCQWMPNWRPESNGNPTEIRRGELHVLEVINELLLQWKQPVLRRLSDLFCKADATIVNSFPEIDHFQPPRKQGYWGTLPSIDGEPPVWPEVAGKRVFAYLKPGKTLPEILQRLAATKQPTLAFVPGISRELQNTRSTRSFRIVDKPLDAQQVVRECDVTISCGGHGLTAQTLLAGKPALVMPQHTEQRLTAYNLKRIRAGLAANSNKPEHVISQLSALLDRPELSAGARQFARKYCDHDPLVTRQHMIDCIERFAHR